jgi:hypothetical protein
MGSASSQQSTTGQNIYDAVYNSCSPTVASNVLVYNKIIHDPHDNCPTSETDITQAARANADCLISNASEAIAKTAATLNSTANQGLGFAVSTNSSNNYLNLTNYVNNQCKDVSATDFQKVGELTVRSCNLHIVQNADANSVCKINTLQKVATQIDANLTATSTGLTLASLFTGYGNTLTTLAIIAGIVAVSYVGFKAFAGKKGKPGEAGQAELAAEAIESGAVGGYLSSLQDPVTFSNGVKSNKSSAFVTILAILLIALIIIDISIKVSSKTNTPLVQSYENIIDKAQIRMAENRVLAGIGTTHDFKLLSNYAY